MASTVLTAIQAAYAASLSNDAKRFSNSIRKPSDVQSQKLTDILSKNANCVYGKKFGFENIANASEYQKKVPIVCYDDIEPYINQIQQGYQNVLTAEPVLMLERSGGSTSTTKYIPYTKGLLNEFSAATNPWIFDLYKNMDKLLGTKSYWSVSPLSHEETHSEGGVPIGFEEETEYFNPVARWALNQMFCVPSSVRHLKTDLEWKQATCLNLIQEENLGMLSVWSPTFLTVLMEYISSNARELSVLLPRKRAKTLLSSVQDNGLVDGEYLWPNLKIISCWSDGISSSFCQNLRSFFPTVFIQGKGLLATEGVITIPWEKLNQKRISAETSHGGVLAINSHFYEFIDLNNESATPKLAHELQREGVYSPVITTSGGLYRYHLKDVIRCSGFKRNTPEIEFLNKLDRVSDICGEKIHANQVDNAIESASKATGIDIDFALLVPSKTPPLHYTLFVDSNENAEKIQQFSNVVDEFLETGHHYSYCKERGQLGPLNTVVIKDGWQRYQDHLASQGQRIGDIKPTRLETRFDWHQVFSSRSIAQ